MPAPAHVFRDRPDTFFGVCEAIGQDFGFNANYLRIAFGLGVFASPVAVVGIYVVLGLAVVVSRLTAPIVTDVPVVSDPVATPLAVNDAETADLAIAA